MSTKKKAGARVGQVGGDGWREVPVDLADGGEDRKAEAEGEDDGGRVGPWRADGGKGGAGGGAAVGQPGAGEAAGGLAQAKGGEGQDEERAEDAACRAEGKFGDAGEPGGAADQGGGAARARAAR